MNISSLKIIGIFIIMFCLSPLSAIDLNQDNNKSTDNGTNDNDSSLDDINNTIDNNDSEYKIEDKVKEVEDDDGTGIINLNHTVNATENKTLRLKDPNLRVEVDDFSPKQEGLVKVYMDESIHCILLGYVLEEGSYLYGFSIEVKNGYGELKLRKGLSCKKHSVLCCFSGDDEFAAVSKTKDFNVRMLKPNLSMQIDDVLPGEHPVVKVYADKSFNGRVQIACPSKFYYRYYADVSNGYGEVTVKENLSADYYDVKCWCSGSDTYDTDECYASFRVGGNKDPNLRVEIADVYEGQRPNINVYGDDNVKGDLRVSCPQFHFSYLLPIYHGYSQCSLDESDLALGNYTVNVEYKGDAEHRPGNVSTSFLVKEKINLDLSIDIDDVYEGTKPVARIHSHPDFNGKLNLKLDKSDKVYTVKMTNGKGIANIDEDLRSGNYTATLSYDGDEIFKPCKSTANFEVLKKIDLGLSMEIDNVSYGHPAIAHIKCRPDFEGNVILKKSFFDDNEYIVEMKEGKGSITLDDLNLGNYTAVVSYDGDEKFNPSIATAKFSVKKFANITVRVTGNDSYSTADIHGDTGLLDLVRVQSNVSDKVYTAVLVYGHGYVGFGKFDPGNYSVTASYAGNDGYGKDQATTNFTIT